MSDGVPFVDLAAQNAVIEQDLAQAFRRVFESSQFVLGAEVRAFETEFATYCGVSHCVGVGSGSDALMLALLASDIGKGDEVILPSHTFVSTALAVSWVGATPVFVDIDENTYTLDPELVKGAVTPRTRAIIPVDLYGQCADMDSLAELARTHGIRLIEDAAQAHGAEYRGKRAGSLGDIGCFSFYPTKNLGAFGDGGAVVTDDDSIAERVRRLRDYGRADTYRFVETGHNSRLDELQAAALRVKLAHLDAWNDDRRRAAMLYDETLAPHVATPATGAGRTHVYHLYVVRNKRRDGLAAYLRDNGVATQVHYPTPTHLQPLYRRLPHRSQELARTEQVATEVLSLPMFVGITNAQLWRVIELVLAFDD
jgi:dTDP-4-amino-4,6-dideoxygalactose transaminase